VLEIMQPWFRDRVPLNEQHQLAPSQITTLVLPRPTLQVLEAEYLLTVVAAAFSCPQAVRLVSWAQEP
jgi:hypothetical protein